jgi:hypothetical protein
VLGGGISNLQDLLPIFIRVRGMPCAPSRLDTQVDTYSSVVRSAPDAPGPGGSVEQGALGDRSGRQGRRRTGGQVEADKDGPIMSCFGSPDGQRLSGLPRTCSNASSSMIAPSAIS